MIVGRPPEKIMLVLLDPVDGRTHNKFQEFELELHPTERLTLVLFKRKLS